LSKFPYLGISACLFWQKFTKYELIRRFIICG